MAHAERRWLVESLGIRLVPELERRGFRAVPLTAGEARSEIRTGFPFGRLRREAADRFDLVEIQLDKHRRAAFRLNLGMVPLGGIEHDLVGHVPAEDVWVHYLAHYYVLYDWPRLRRWFSPWRWPGTAPGRSDYERLVEKVVGLLPEVEALFREGKGGRHLRQVGPIFSSRSRDRDRDRDGDSGSGIRDQGFRCAPRDSDR